MKIVVLDGYTLNPGDLDWSGLAMLGELRVYDRTADSEIMERIGDAQIVMTNKTPITGDTLATCPQLAYVGVLATGYNVVDVEAARARGVLVTNIPAYGTQAVMQHTFALLLELCHHAGAHSDAVHAGEWQKCPDFCFWKYPLVELAELTLGIIGMGRIGRSVAKTAQAFGMRVVAHDPGCQAAVEGVEMLPLDALYAKADVISLHCPLLPENTGMIRRESIARMKRGVMIINTSRGPLISEQDLCDALKSGKVAGAAVDVVSAEPIRPDNPLLGAPSCIITPHIAWASLSSRRRLLQIAIDNLRAYLAGAPVNAVT